MSKINTMKPAFALAKVFLVTTVVYSCHPVYYSPQSTNAPLLEKKGDANIGGSTSLTSFSLNTAYAFSHKISGQVNISKAKYEYADDLLFSSGNYKVNQLQLSAGLGFVKKLNNNLLFETFCLGYKGSFKNTYEHTGSNAINFEGPDNLPRNKVYTELSGKYYSFKSQNSLAYSKGIFTLVGTLSLNRLAYFNVTGDLKYNNQNQADYIHQHTAYYFLEPSITARLSFEKINFQIQYLYSNCLTEKNFLSVKNVVSASFYKTFNFKRNKKTGTL